MKHLPRWQRIIYVIVTAIVAFGMIGMTFMY